MKIDIFNHIFPKKFFDKYIDAGQGGKDIGKRVSNIQTIVDVDSRFRILDEFGDYVQVITLPLPPLEILAGPDKSPELAREGNDGLAELVKKHDRFLGFAASLADEQSEGRGERNDASARRTWRIRRSDVHQRGRQAARFSGILAACLKRRCGAIFRSGFIQRAARISRIT